MYPEMTEFILFETSFKTHRLGAAAIAQLIKALVNEASNPSSNPGPGI